MRKVSAAWVLAVAWLATTAATAAGQQPPTDSVVGGASQCIETIEYPGMTMCARLLGLDLDVRSGPAGENPAGAVTWSQQGLTPGGSPRFTAEATCLSVSGRVAIVGITGTWIHPGATGYTAPIAGLVRVTDGGGPSTGGDRFEFALTQGPQDGPPLPGPAGCSTFPGPFPVGASVPSFVNAVGDVIVTDMQPLPTTKDACRHGGWREFPGFRNQGDCVSFVATGRR
jgi:hypothetical protein